MHNFSSHFDVFLLVMQALDGKTVLTHYSKTNALNTVSIAFARKICYTVL